MSQTQRKTYLVFDRTTGATIGTYSAYDAQTRSYVEQSPEKTLEAFQGQLQGRTRDQVGIAEIALPQGQDVGGYYFDAKTGKAIPRLQMDVKPERTQLQGDGKDSVEIHITVLGDGGTAAHDFNADLRVTTSRGRLSAPGGRIKAVHGSASIKLTSVPETVGKVSITVQDLIGRCKRGGAKVEFV